MIREGLGQAGTHVGLGGAIDLGDQVDLTLVFDVVTFAVVLAQDAPGTRGEGLGEGSKILHTAMLAHAGPSTRSAGSGK
ncbi:hypothetical protein D3C87_2088360 [compost metagenome]